MKNKINIVWFKRDLRLSDHPPLKHAFASSLPTLLIYNFEPILLQDPHYSARHWRFVYQSIKDMNNQLARFNTKVYYFNCDMQMLLNNISEQFDIDTIFSHQEIGLEITFKRDIAIKKWCNKQQIKWYEFPTGAVIRGSKNRDDWANKWHKTMQSELAVPNWHAVNSLPLQHYQAPLLPLEFTQINDNFQIGGAKHARNLLHSFFNERGKGYQKGISSPSLSQVHCSRLSPHLAWGNISIKQVYQQAIEHYQTKKSGWRRPLSAFISRLHWHCHFMQKFESECSMQFSPLNSAYQHFPYRQDKQVELDLQRFANGQTGIPIIDACMRCLKHTGYINFRMRAMLVSFVTHHLNISWQQVSLILARYFLDFEPGIHYPQIQMQASVTGINTIRHYNPIKQSQDQDTQGLFIKTWCRELTKLPVEYLHQPWQQTPMEALFNDFKLGEDYPLPMIDLTQASKKAKQRLWQYRERPDVISAIAQILKKHVNMHNSKQQLKLDE
ncbi:deoxyribodipyrimidine photo-lyase [Pseudoalteromonas sp. MMG010]|uniref:cryptochrome/deoxyribodipyrimidine photo-lyase family protein n=1 Tax=Pseudoalteromonas sp. MMG010 TaxID=2822685 RepID=UPI001B3A0872|nr:deoxyribodipyrimidine photo-lyase [Pseudoalteromonas sp. MMG010]MBQ4832152.1 deoxyribodipyrimidine photo-lyase [Pseudoalteromonas sp. MMG010]